MHVHTHMWLAHHQLQGITEILQFRTFTRDPIVLQKVRKQGIKFCYDCPKSKETRNKILAQVNTKEIIYKILIPTFGLLVITD